METEWRQKGDKKMSMISHEGFVGETFINNGFRAIDEYISTRRARNAGLFEYVMPFIF